MAESKKGWVLLKVFLGAFVLALVVGFVSGTSIREDLKRSLMVSSMRLIKANGTIFLGAKCHNSVTHVFNPGAQTVDINPSIDVDSSLGSTFNVRTHKDVILAFVGGSTGAMTLQGIVQASSNAGKVKSGIEKIVATVLGASSGYLFGYWAGTYSTDNCDSSAMANYFANPEEWKVASRAFFWLKIHELGYADSRFSDSSSEDVALIALQQRFKQDPINKCGFEVARALELSVQRVQGSQHPGIIDFAALVSFEEERDRLSVNPDYREFVRCTKSPYASCFNPGLCALVK